ncbi:ATP-dependent RNA helicase HelY [Desulforamulus aeronauticus DSM 10349]|uniref:ATP-dependent RNA helicase HelY n=1 Tax=Desulforamulus aeronauticus DSM 10349 TaxID=1121421 RepID=A0A1M6SET0_9FIRM|nr:ATP-dependent RNA helicase HelY [Desulforamulus aeronauticus DSM 10349]
MAVKDKETLKMIILTELPEDRPVKLVDLALKVRQRPQVLLSVLQSLVSNRLLKVAKLHTDEAGPTIWLARNEVPEAALGNAGEGDWSYSPQLVAVRQKQLAAILGDDARGRILRLLSDGQPRNSTQIKLALGDEELPALGNIEQLVELPEGDFTLRTSAAGRAEMERRRQEQKLLEEKHSQQERILRELFKSGQALSKEAMEQALGGPILPKVKYPVLRLTNGEYAQADSPAAWQDVATYLTRSGPLTMEDFIRKFRIHSTLVANLRSDREVPPFVILPDGKITTAQTPEGAGELAHRKAGQGLKERLTEIFSQQPFFNISQVTENPEQREVAVKLINETGSFRVNINGVGLWTSPYPHEPKKIAQELKRLTGMHLETKDKQELPPLTWLTSHSMTIPEAAYKLKLSEEDVHNLCELEALASFRLAGGTRLWRDEVQDIKYRPDLHKLVKKASKLTTVEAADLLNTTPDRIRRLVREGYLNSAGEVEKENGRVGLLVRRGDIQAIQEKFQGIEHEWSLAAKQQRREAALTTPVKKEKPPAGKKRPRRAVSPPPASPGPVELDQFQQQAVKAALAGQNVLVAAPTGTGKTVIAERLIEAVIERGKAAVYTSPLKALSNQKFVDFRNVFGNDMVGLVTGDISINPYAPLLIMTTEIFRNRCFSEPEGLDDVACVVFDEIHYLDDPERGTAWEESIIFAPPHIKFLGLSATVPNIQEIANWMGEVRGEAVEVVVETNRAVPLAINWLSSDGVIMDEDEAREYIEEAVRKRSEQRRAEREAAKEAAREEGMNREDRRWKRRGGASRSRKSLDRY